MVIVAKVQATTHMPSIKALKDTFKISAIIIKQTLKQISIIATHHAISILFHRKRLKNKQSLPNTLIQIQNHSNHIHVDYFIVSGHAQQYFRFTIKI